MTPEQKAEANAKRRAQKAAKIMPSVDCPCLCHDMHGGPAHPGRKCACNGGRGMF